MAFVTALPLTISSSPSRSICRPTRVHTTRHTTRMTIAVPPGTELYRPAPDQVLPTGPLTESEISHFFREGYVIARNLIPPALLAELQAATPALEAAPSINVPLYAKISFRAWAIHPIFKKVATDSPVALAVAQLTPHDAHHPRGLCVLNDAYFHMKPGNKGCNFHVDDPVFWPTKQGEPGPGVNAWMALDDVEEGGGGLAVAPGSFREGFVDCRRAIEGRTCMIGQVAPELSERLEGIAVKPIMKAGDVILHTRYLFHRGDPFRVEGRGGIRRYSVRYMPGEAVVDEVEDVKVEEGKMLIIAKEGVRLMDGDVEKFPAVLGVNT